MAEWGEGCIRGRGVPLVHGAEGLRQGQKRWMAWKSTVPLRSFRYPQKKAQHRPSFYLFSLYKYNMSLPLSRKWICPAQTMERPSQLCGHVFPLNFSLGHWIRERFQLTTTTAHKKKKGSSSVLLRIHVWSNCWQDSFLFNDCPYLSIFPSTTK